MIEFIAGVGFGFALSFGVVAGVLAAVVRKNSKIITAWGKTNEQLINCLFGEDESDYVH